MVKECTGHASDAIDKYQITSDEQREMLSSIIAHKHETNVTEITKTDKDTNPPVQVLVTQNDKGCTCGNVKTVNKSNVGDLVSEIIDKVGNGGNHVVKIQIEIMPK